MVWTPHRSGSDDAEVMLRAQLDFTRTMLDGFAGGARAYWSAWGVWGMPAIWAVETAAEAQRRYLETLRASLS